MVKNSFASVGVRIIPLVVFSGSAGSVGTEE